MSRAVAVTTTLTRPDCDATLHVTGQWCPAEPDVGIDQPYVDDVCVYLAGHDITVLLDEVTIGAAACAILEKHEADNEPDPDAQNDAADDMRREDGRE